MFGNKYDLNGLRFYETNYWTFNCFTTLTSKNIKYLL